MASAYTWRHATGDVGPNHGYEVGQWPTGVDITDARQFAVNECWYDQQTAARRANAFNAGTVPPTAWTAFSNNAKANKPPFK